MRQLFDSILGVGIITFCEKYGENFIRHLSELKETGLDTAVTCERFKEIRDMVLTGENRKEYINGDTETTTFDVFYAEGFIPSYSFPKNVVRFYVEDPQTTGRRSQHEVKYAPERDIAVAISEYAPGRFITIDKKTYKSGGIYSNPRPKGYESNPAEYYFGRDDYYFKDIYVCSECNWFGNKDEFDKCPYCGADIEHHKMLRPWGFAPVRGDEVRNEDVDEEKTYAEAPYYSHVPNDPNMPRYKQSNIRYINLDDQKVLTVNMGQKKNGFNICRKCGGAELADPKRTTGFTFSQPYHDRVLCRHDGMVEANIFLGYEFLTDMFMLDIEYDTEKLVGMRTEEEKSILRSAITTLHEAIKKAVSLELQIDYSEINGGWRPRKVDDGKFHIEMFFYDNLTSGAGYSSLISGELDAILSRAREILTECDCDRSCKNCLDNYYNQRNHALFDRSLGLQLLDYAVLGQLPEYYEADEQDRFLVPFIKLIKEETGKAPRTQFEVIPALRKKSHTEDGKMYLNPYDLSDWLPNAFVAYMNL